MSNSIHAQRLANLRGAFQKEQIDGFIVPRADEYQGEYVPACADRLRYLTGFTGSAGFAVVLKDRAGVFSDGRYTIQLKQQIDLAHFEAGDSTKITAAEWVARNAPDAVIGYDPRLHTPREIKAFADKGVATKAVSTNILDEVWERRPAAPDSAVELFPLSSAGESAREKLDRVAGVLKEKGVNSAIITLPDSIAWLLNIRGSDIPHIPVALSYGIVHEDGTFDWFIDPKRVPDAVTQSFGNRVSLIVPHDLEKSIAGLKGKKILIDERRSSVWFINHLKLSSIEYVDLKDPCIALKARKNSSEIASMKNAHERDGVAVTKFLAWLSIQDFETSDINEIDIEKQLEAFRREANAYRDSSFDTIAGFGPNGAIVHYRATEETALTLRNGNLLLLDSGAQYADGTTDITRTIAIGQPTQEMKDRFTLVLKGHIALASAKFPVGTTGAQIDVLARTPLWQQELDFAHGTGHGVGCYLSVHEESASISPRGMDALEEGMILSNEPGYYKEGEYGIRIENLVLVKHDGVCADTGKQMLSFETLTYAPMDPALVSFEMLSDTDKEWLKSYHNAVQEKLSPHLSADEQAFLTKICDSYYSFAKY
jgi:Xaa-Pro aminopeptidase